MPRSCPNIFFFSLLVICVFLSIFFLCLHFPSSHVCPLCFEHLCQRMPQTKQRQDHTKRQQSVEDQAPYGEHINSKACGTHSCRAPSHLQLPPSTYSQRGPSAVPSSADTSPQPHQLTAVKWGERQTGNMCRLRPHTHTHTMHKCTKSMFYTRGIQMCGV